MAHGKTLCLSLEVRVLIELKRLPEVNRSNIWWAGWEESDMMDLALLRHRVLDISSMEGRGQPMIFCAKFMTLCNDFLSPAELPAHHAVME